MLSILLDEQISPEIARQIKIKRPEITIFSIHFWHQGHFLGMSDEAILQAAKLEHLTLVTYDKNTIPPVLVDWRKDNIDHAGVIFIDYRTISPNNFGGLIKAIIWLWLTQGNNSWQNRIVYLQPS